MEYLVLARKWRPQVFDDVVGQDHVVTTLKNAVRMGRIAHAYLFSGPRGTGKTSVARILSKALNCERGPTEEPCTVCTPCREIAGGISLDVREIDGASNRGIDEVRELRENIKFSPVSSRYKVYIIDEVHMLTNPAFNALLKTLEEPPAHVVFMFATTEIHKVPATILSRCQHFDFRRIPLGTIVGNLRYIAEQENIQITDNGLTIIARAGEGSLRDAQSVFDQVISYAGTDVADGDVEDLLGVTASRFVTDLTRGILDHDAARCLGIIHEAYYNGVDFKQLYHRLVDRFMNLLVMKITDGKELLSDVADHERDELNELAMMVSREDLQRFVDICMAEEMAVKRSRDPRINLEKMTVTMAYLEPLIPVTEIVSRMERLEERLRTAKGPAAPVPGRGEQKPEQKEMERAAPANDAPASGEQVWNRLKNSIKQKDMLLWSKIAPGTFQHYDEKTLTIGFPPDYVFLDDVRDRGQMDRLSALAADIFKRPLSVVIVETNGGEGQNTRSNGDVGREQEIKNEALRHPIVQKTMDVFNGAEIRDVIIRNNADK